MIDRIVQESDVANLNNAMLSNAEKKLSSSLYHELCLTMIDERKWRKIVRNVAVGEGAIALDKLLAECQPDIVNRHLGLLMSTMNWSIRKDSARLNTYAQMRAEVVDLSSCRSRAPYAHGRRWSIH